MESISGQMRTKKEEESASNFVNDSTFIDVIEVMVTSQNISKELPFFPSFILSSKSVSLEFWPQFDRIEVESYIINYQTND